MTDETKRSDETATAPKSKKKIGVSKSAPASAARRLGTPAPKRSHSKKKTSSDAQTVTSADVASVSADALVGSADEKVVDTSTPAHVDLPLSNTETSQTATSLGHPGDVAHSEEDTKIMASISLTLDPKTRKSTSVVFKLPSGLRGSVRIAKTAFPDGVPPASLTLQSDSETAFAQPRATLSAEQRKELRKNAPKLTPAQKLAKLQERAAKLQAKIAAEAAAPATT